MTGFTCGVSMKQHIAKSSFWILWSRGVVQALSFASTILVARLLHPSDYGLMAAATVSTGALFLITELGLGAAIVQFPHLRDEELNACFWLAITIGLLGYGLLCWAAPSIAAWFDMPPLRSMLTILGAILPISVFRVVGESLLRKRLELDKVAKSEILAKLVSIPVVIGMAVTHFGVWALVYGALSMPIIQTLCVLLWVRWWPGVRIGSRRLKDILGFSFATLGMRLCATAYQQADTIILGRIKGDIALGFFSMAKQLAELPMERISVVVNQLAVPVFARMQASRVEMRAAFLRAIRLVACITVPLSVGIALLARDLISVILTDKWLTSAPLLQVLCVYGMVRSIDVLFPPVLMARYRVMFLFWYVLGLLVIMPTMFWLGATTLGGLGVALAWMLVYPIMMVRLAREVLTELEIDWRTMWGEVRVILGSAVVMAAVVMWAKSMLVESGIGGSGVRLALTVGVGAVVYAMGVLWRGGQVVSELREVLGWAIGRHGVLRTSD